MGATKFTSALPFVLFGAVVVAFGGWMIHETTNASPHGRKAHHSKHEPGEFGPPLEAILGEIHLGMPRRIVEQRLMVLPCVVEPIDLSTGSPVCRSRYRVLVNHPLPHLAPDIPPHTFKPGWHTLVLDFDGRQPEHPLCRVRFVHIDTE